MPDKITLERVIEKRGNTLYFDYLQLWAGRTMPAPYSVRATPQATVATPVTWEEIEHGMHPGDFTMFTVPQHLEEKGDLFAKKKNEDIDDILDFLRTHKR
jgi:bifunctional non-homologous end joining protein LigD